MKNWRGPSLLFCQLFGAYRYSYRANLCPNGEKLVPVPKVNQLVSLLSAGPVLRKNTVSSMRPRSEEVDLVIGASEKNEKESRTELLLSVTKPFNDVQNPFRVTNLVRTLDPPEVHTEQNLVHEATHAHPGV